MICIDSIKNVTVSSNSHTSSFKYGFENYDDLEAYYTSVEAYVKKVAEGNISSLIVNGPPGLGKTYSVEEYLGKYCKQDYKVVTGHMTVLSLYMHLYAHKDKGQVLVLDDVDTVFNKVEGLNILKGAMDTKPVRKISWESSSTILRSVGIPKSFQFEGSVILISNIGFGGTSRKSKLNAHLDALKDRSYLLSTKDVSLEGLYKQVCFMVLEKDMLSSYDLTEVQKHEILSYIGENLENVTKVSLRLAVKLAQLVVADPLNWKEMAITGLFTEV
jgi:hypothetical protein